MQAALLNFEKQPGAKIAILGDMFELGDNAETEHQNIVGLALSVDINQVIFIGENFHQSKTNLPKKLQYKTFEDFKSDFYYFEIEKETLLIKGSRGMALERVLDLI